MMVTVAVLKLVLDEFVLTDLLQGHRSF